MTHITIHNDLVQGSDEWLAARCGLLTASEMKLLVGFTPATTTTKYTPVEGWSGKVTPARLQCLNRCQDKIGTVAELAFASDVSESIVRGLIKDGAIGPVQAEVAAVYRAMSDDREKTHLWELLGQRITQYVEPHYVSDDMLRGQEDEVFARAAYSEHYAPVEEAGFITNCRWGFTIGYSPDGLVGDDGLIECKSRRQKYQIETIATNTVPSEYWIQLQTGLLVAEREWIDFVSYSGGLPMCVIRVHPDPTAQDAIVNAAGEFERRLAEKLALYHEAVATRNMVPTERRVEQEMFLGDGDGE